MDREGAARCHVRCPEFEIETGRLHTMSAIDEQERERSLPIAGHGRRGAHHRDHDVLETRPGDRATEVRKRVHESGLRVDQRLVVPLPTRLILLGATMVIDREHDRVVLPGRGTEPHRGPTAIRADFEKR